LVTTVLNWFVKAPEPEVLYCRSLAGYFERICASANCHGVVRLSIFASFINPAYADPSIDIGNKKMLVFVNSKEEDFTQTGIIVNIILTWL